MRTSLQERPHRHVADTCAVREWCCVCQELVNGARRLTLHKEDYHEVNKLLELGGHKEKMYVGDKKGEVSLRGVEPTHLEPRPRAHRYGPANTELDPQPRYSPRNHQPGL